MNCYKQIRLDQENRKRDLSETQESNEHVMKWVRTEYDFIVLSSLHFIFPFLAYVNTLRWAHKINYNIYLDYDENNRSEYLYIYIKILK